MRLLGRTGTIIGAALVVVGVTWALANMGLIGSTRGAQFEGGSRAERQFQPPQDAASGNATGTAPVARGGFEGGPRGGGLFRIFEVFQNLAIIGVIVALVSVVSWLLDRRRRTMKRSSAPPDSYSL